MSALDMTVMVLAWLGLLFVVGRREIGKVLADFRDGLAARDRRADCSAYGGKLVYGSADAVELERLRSGAAFVEAMALTLAEIRGLPQTPVGRSSWS